MSFNTKKVKKIKNIFSKCYYLEKLQTGDNFVISRITDLSGIFS